MKVIPETRVFIIMLAINPSDAQPDAGKLNMVTYGYGSGGCT
jgi:hypothetical protein